jgi:RNA polymerase sigma-70 factor (ECF subfamily)
MDMSEASPRVYADAPASAKGEMSEAAARDADVTALLKDGRHVEAFTELVERYEAKVFRLCCALLKDGALAQDMAQETFLRVWRALDCYDPAIGAFSTWIYAIARNRCLTALEREPAHSHSMSDPDVWDQVGQIAATATVNDAASLAWLRQQVDALPANLRSSLTLFYYEDRSVSEVAAMLGLPEGTVKTHLHRARAALHDELQKRGLAEAALWL